MKKGLTELVFILDRSGSMSGLEKETIGGYNSTLDRQKNEKGEACVSTVLFDNEMEVLHDRIPIQNVVPLTEKQYYARGSTALMDAIGRAIHHIGNVHKYAREEDRPEKTIFVITTDGYENDSHKYSIQQVQSMIKRQKEKYGWEFLFLGANIDAIKTAESIGIHSSRAANFIADEEGVNKMYKAQEMLLCDIRQNRATASDDSWKRNLEDDYMKRKKRG